MKKLLLPMGISVVVLTLSPILAVAQSCGIYTYQDMWVDDNGNAVGENLSEGDASCGEYTAFANVTLTMPSGNSQSGYGSGSPFAEALAAASTSGEQGDGLLDGSNDVDFSCDSAFASFSLPFELDLAYSKSKWNNTYTTLLGGSVRCFVDSWCTADTTPPTCDPDYVDQHPLILVSRRPAGSITTQTGLHSDSSSPGHRGNASRLSPARTQSEQTMQV